MSDPHEHFEEGEEAAPSGARVMAVVRWIIVGAMALLAAGSLYAYFGGSVPGSGAADGAQYYCPMHPAVVQDHPGECPICGMDLVRREPAGAPASQPASQPGSQPSSQPGSQPSSAPSSGPASQPSSQPHEVHVVPGLQPIDLSPERVQLIGMKTAAVERGALVSELRTVGYVVANEEGLARIHTRFAGWIESLKVSQTGQKVKKDEILATIYSPELLSAQQELLTALEWEEQQPGKGGAVGHIGAPLGKDARRRLELLGISKQEIERLVTTKEPMRAVPIRSPVRGYVTRKAAIQGAYVQPGTELFEIADLSTVWVLGEVYERDLGRIAVGQTARLEVPAYPEATRKGRVEFLYPTFDSGTRTLRVRVEFPNPDLLLRPGMYGDLVIELPQKEGLFIPREAVADVGTIQYVFVSLPGGRFEPRKVVLGARSGENVEVLEGLTENEVVVTTGNFLLDSESRLKSAIEGAGHVGH